LQTGDRASDDIESYDHEFSDAVADKARRFNNKSYDITPFDYTTPIDQHGYHTHRRSTDGAFAHFWRHAHHLSSMAATFRDRNTHYLHGDCNVFGLLFCFCFC
jgi:hypothetical protein